MQREKSDRIASTIQIQSICICGQNATKVIYASRGRISHYGMYYSGNYSNYFNPYFISHYSGNYRIPKVTTIVGTVIPAIVLTLGNYISVST